MMRLLLDIYKTNNLHSGLGQFSLNFHNAILRHNKNWELEFLAPSTFNHLKSEKAHYREANFKSRYFPGLGKKVDLWHSLHQFPSHPAPKECKQILTIHDLNFLKEKNSKKAELYLRKLQKNVDRADIITSISDYTSEQIKSQLDLKGKKIQTIYNGINLLEFPDFKSQTILKEKFFFSIGIFSEKKNFHSLLPLMEKLKEYKLIIAGDHNTAYGEQMKLKIKALKLQDQVILTGRISDAEKYWYYKNCEAFLFPSLAEGFGMPAIEAMTQGKAVFSSDQCSLPEIGGDASFYWTNFESEKMLKILEEGLEELRKDPLTFQEKQKKHAARFSWDNCIKKYLKLYDSAFT